MRLLSCMLAGLIGLTLAMSGTAAAEPLTVRTGWVVATSGYTPLVLEKKELLTHYGTSYVLDPRHFQGTAPQLTAFAANEIDIATIVKAVEDLKSKVVATNGFGGAYDVGMRSMLRKHGLEDKRDYSVVESDFAHMNAMLLERKVDLVIGSMPFALDADMQANAHVLFTLRDAMGRTQMIVMAARQGFLDQNRAALADFFADMLASLRWFHDPANRDEAIAIVARVTKQPVERLGAYLYSKNDFYYDRNGLPDLDALQRNVDSLGEAGMIKGEIDVRKYVDLSFVETAAKQLK